MLTDIEISERRFHPRTQLTMAVQAIRLDPDGIDLVEQLEMVDLSRGGLGAMCGQRYYPGQRVVLKLPAPGMGVRSICAIVRRCGKADQRYRLGIEFEHPIASLALEQSEVGLDAVAA